MRNLLLLLGLVLVGCSTTTVNIHTVPEGADVYARPVGGGAMVYLGKTPFYTTNRELEKTYGGSGALYLELQMKGYKTDAFFVTELSKIDLTINRDLTTKKDMEQQYSINSSVAKMFEVRRLVEAKQLDKALKLVRELKEEAPMVSTVHQMEAGILLLSREYRSALDSYRLALKLNPEDAEAVKMIRYLEKTFNFPREVDITETKLPTERSPSDAGSGATPQGGTK